MVLAKAVDKLSVLNLGDVGWTDLGEPDRVISALSQTGVKKDWSSRWVEARAAAGAY
jgi:hypothetical protein